MVSEAQDSRRSDEGSAERGGLVWALRGGGGVEGSLTEGLGLR